MSLSIFEQIRTASKEVALNASDICLNEEKIYAYAALLPLEQASLLRDIDSACHYLEQGNDTAAFFLTLGAINFGSGYFPYLRKRPGMSGYYTIASSLNDLYKKQGPLSSRELAQLTVDDCLKIFNQDADNRPVFELMQLFVMALNELGLYLLDHFDGDVVNLIKASDSSVEKLVKRLIEIPCFKDIGWYGERKVPFYKRAQLVAADLTRAFKGKGPGQFSDLDQLTIFADNVVPHVLRIDGILNYEKNLAARIDAGKLIPAGSPEEIEIRACAIYAGELIIEALKKMSKNITAMELDYLLWTRGHQPHYRQQSSHRTQTIFY